MDELMIDARKLQRMPPSALARKMKITNAESKALIAELKQGEDFVDLPELILIICRIVDGD